MRKLFSEKSSNERDKLNISIQDFLNKWIHENNINFSRTSQNILTDIKEIWEGIHWDYDQNVINLEIKKRNKYIEKLKKSTKEYEELFAEIETEIPDYEKPRGYKRVIWEKKKNQVKDFQKEIEKQLKSIEDEKKRLEIIRMNPGKPIDHFNDVIDKLYLDIHEIQKNKLKDEMIKDFKGFKYSKKKIRIDPIIVEWIIEHQIPVSKVIQSVFMNAYIKDTFRDYYCTTINSGLDDGHGHFWDLPHPLIEFEYRKRKGERSASTTISMNTSQFEAIKFLFGSIPIFTIKVLEEIRDGVRTESGKTEQVCFRLKKEKRLRSSSIVIPHELWEYTKKNYINISAVVQLAIDELITKISKNRELSIELTLIGGYGFSIQLSHKNPPINELLEIMKIPRPKQIFACKQIDNIFKRTSKKLRHDIDDEIINWVNKNEGFFVPDGNSEFVEYVKKILKEKSVGMPLYVFNSLYEEIPNEGRRTFQIKIP